MSAVEVIAMIEKLSLSEQAEVLAHLRKKPVEREVRYVPQDELEKVADRVFKDHAKLLQKLAQ